MSRIQAFNEATLARHFTKEDFHVDERLLDDVYREEVVAEAVEQAGNLFPGGVSYSSFHISKKKSFSISSLPQKLVFRACASHLKRAFDQRGKSRSQVAREIKVFLIDGTPCNVIRLDIKSFFESIEQSEMERCIDTMKGLSMHTKKVLERKIRFFKEKEGVCVPRGVETSSILSDIYLFEFDRYVVSREEVFYYSRFVDDIVVIASDQIEGDVFYKDLEKSLPQGLRFNKDKEEIKKIKKRKKAGSIDKGNIVGEFDYLGFRFSIIDTPLPLKKECKGVPKEENSKTAPSRFRCVEVDLSPKKVKRIKEKLCKAFYSFGKNGDYDLLKDRVRFLTTNREFVKKDGEAVIPVGVYYNSSACDIPSKKLAHLDKFMRYLLYGKNGRLHRFYSGRLSDEKRQELIKFSFSYGFNNRVHKKFSLNRLSQIVKVWR